MALTYDFCKRHWQKPHAGRRCMWERLVVPSLREQGYNEEHISSRFEEETASAKGFAYALAEEIRQRVLEKEKRSSDANVNEEVRAAR
jgi:hypothetical protein